MTSLQRSLLARTLALLRPALLLTLLAAGASHATPTLVLQGTELAGANNVDVDGTLYDVRFVDGTCVAVYGGCEVANFTFQNRRDAKAAAQVLLDDVFLNDVLGNFDWRPRLTLGCGSTSMCVALVPFSVAGTEITSAIALNSSAPDGDMVGLGFDSLPGRDDTDRVWTVWSLAGSNNTPEPNNIPEPGSLLLVAAAIGLMSRRRGTAARHAGV